MDMLIRYGRIGLDIYTTSHFDINLIHVRAILSFNLTVQAHAGRTRLAHCMWRTPHTGEK
jgi:hypothetical protein